MLNVFDTSKTYLINAFIFYFILLFCRFRTFEHAQKDINEMVECWDRTTLSIKRPPTPSERSDEDHNHPPSGKKGKGKGIQNKMMPHLDSVDTYNVSFR